VRPVLGKKQNAASMNADCKALGCANSAVVGPAGQDVCLEHFFSDCYEELEKLEPLVGSRWLAAAEVDAVSAVLEECSRRAIFICFRNEPLSNLDRSRLLEILLSCRDIQFRLRCRAVSEPPESTVAAPSRK
jgi:hypothetical protein